MAGTFQNQRLNLDLEENEDDGGNNSWRRRRRRGGTLKRGPGTSQPTSKTRGGLYVDGDFLFEFCVN